MYELLYTKLNCRGLLRGNKEKIRKYLCNINPEQWAVYRTMFNGHTFHNATDVDFLVDHNDSFWYNCNVKPSGLFGNSQIGREK